MWVWTYYDGIFLCTLNFYLAAQGGGGVKPPNPPPPPVDPPLRDPHPHPLMELMQVLDNASWVLAWVAASVASTSSQPTLAKKRAKKTQICRDVDFFFLGGGIFLTPPPPSQSEKWIDAAV